MMATLLYKALDATIPGAIYSYTKHYTLQSYTGHILNDGNTAATATQNGSIRFPPHLLPHEMFPYLLFILQQLT